MRVWSGKASREGAKPFERCLADETVVKEEGPDSGKVAERGDSFAEFDELLIETGRLKDSGRLLGCVRRLPDGAAVDIGWKTRVEAGAERVTRSFDFSVVFGVRPDRPVGGAEERDHSAAMYAW